MKYGVQIFGCLPEFRRDPKGFLARLESMGYGQVEPCVIFGREEDYPSSLWQRLWKPEEVPAFEEEMNQLGLKLSSCHVFAQQLDSLGDQLLELAKNTSIDTFVVNCPQSALGPGYLEFAAACRSLAAQLGQQGVSLWLHNGGPEIAARVERDGQEITLLEAILQEAGEGLGAQIDTGWVLFGGIDPTLFLQKLGSRVKSVHFKDMAPDCQHRSGMDRFAVLGKGITDIPSVLRAIPSSVGSVLVDQDASQGDFLQDLEDSLEALRREEVSL